MGHVIQRATSFSVGSMDPSKWTILTATVITHQNKVSIGSWSPSCVIDFYM